MTSCKCWQAQNPDRIFNKNYETNKVFISFIITKSKLPYLHELTMPASPVAFLFFALFQLSINFRSIPRIFYV